MRLQKFQPSGAFVEQIGPLAPGDFGNLVAGLAVDSSGAFYFASGESVRKYSAGGALLSGEKTFGFGTNALAVDGADNLFIANSISLTPFPDGSLGAQTAIYEFNAAEEPVRTFYGRGALHTKPVSLALRSDVFGDVFAAEGGFASELRVVKIPFPPPGPEIPTEARLLGAEPVGAVRATLRASVNPEGVASKVRFEYVKVAICEADEEALGPEHCFDGAHVTPEADVEGTDFKLHPASAQIACDSESPAEGSCLEPATAYRFRAVAANADGEVRSPAADFTTLDSIGLGAAWSTGVGAATATLHAELNPRSLPTTGFFEYVDRASFEASGFATAAKAPDVDAGSGAIDFGAGEGMTVRGASLSGLQPATEYRYRYVARNFFGSFPGPEGSFTTFSAVLPASACPNEAFRVGPAAALPDCRGYEMVSPLDKNNSDIVVPASSNSSTPASYFQSEAGGAGLTYASVQAFGDPAGAPYVSQYLARRDGGSGWASESISPPRDRNLAASLPGLASINNQFKAFSGDLSSAWLWQAADPPLGNPPGVERYWNLYRRDNSGGAYEALTREAPPNLPPGNVEIYSPVLQGFTEDGGMAVYRAEDGLPVDEGVAAKPGTAGKGSPEQIYELRDGRLRLVSVLPNGAASGAHNTVGSATALAYADENVAAAVSADGSRIYWTAAVEGVREPGTLYLRLGGAETVKVSEAAPARFWTATPDGSAALYEEAGQLRRFDLEGGVHTTIAGGFLGLLGASTDLSRVYLVSSQALDAGASAGKPNLYLYEEGVGFTFIGVLSDAVFGRDFSDSVSPFKRTARVSADGDRAVFMSSRSLTGYDNADAGNGKPATEVYLYQAGSGLLCISCNPAGTRPLGREAPAEDIAYYHHYGAGQVSSQIPGWQTTFYAQRVLSTDGHRIFFESYDALLPADSNGRMDVYEWEAVGAGGCTEGAPDYFAQNGGCLYLISSGAGAGASNFADASPSGDDVFFTTASSLVQQDYGLIDVYDARVGGGFPPPPPGAAPCEGDACQPAPSAPDSITPSSSSFHGAGNVAPASPCRGSARKAHRLSLAARRAKRAASRAASPLAKRKLRRRASGFAKRARRHSRVAKRCRARLRSSRQGGQR